MRRTAHRGVKSRPRAKTIGKLSPKTGKQAVALVVRQALLRKPRVVPGLALMLKESPYFKAHRRAFLT